MKMTKQVFEIEYPTHWGVLTEEELLDLVTVFGSDETQITVKEVKLPATVDTLSGKMIVPSETKYLTGEGEG